MVADVHRDDRLPADAQFERYAIGKIDGNRVQPIVPAGQGVQSQRGVMRISFKQDQCLAVLPSQFWVAAQKTQFRAHVAFREEELPPHAASAGRSLLARGLRWLAGRLQ